jgi:hypothetical protein
MTQRAPAVATKELDGQIDAVERITRLFWPERIVYICLAVVAFAMLLFFLALAVVRQQHDPTVLLSEFGPSGLVAYTSSRVLLMWNKAMALVVSAARAGR